MRNYRLLVAIFFSFIVFMNEICAAPPNFWFAYVAEENTTNVTPIQLKTLGGTPAASSIPIPLFPVAVAITPDANFSYVVANDSTTGAGEVDVIDNNTNQLVQTITFPNGALPIQIAITPDGKTAYVADFGNSAVTPIDIATNTLGTPIPITGGILTPVPIDVAINPNNKTAYVVDAFNGVVRLIDIPSNTLSPISIPVGLFPISIAITPNGQKAYVANGIGDTVTVIDLTTNTPINTIPVTPDPVDVVINPLGTRAYVLSSDTFTGNGTITVIDTNSDTIIAVFLEGLATNPTTLAISPDGLTGYVTDTAANTVTVIDLTANVELLNPIQMPADASAPDAIAITPDQAPFAIFTSTTVTVGSPTTFDASASFSNVGSIALYIWDFGDGSTAVTTNPIITHTYATPGNFTATLTVVNTAGTSTTVVFTGHTVSNNGGPSATTSHTVVVLKPILPPRHAHGFQLVNRFATQSDFVNVVKWKSPRNKSAHPVEYLIFSNPQLTELLARVPANQEHLEFVQHNRKKGRTYKYFIVSVDKLGRHSVPAKVIVHPISEDRD